MFLQILGCKSYLLDFHLDFGFFRLQVFFKLFLGLILASIVQWELLRGRSIYRILLFAVRRACVYLTLVFKGLFNKLR